MLEVFCFDAYLLFWRSRFLLDVDLSLFLYCFFFGFSMRRVTFSLEEADHLALKLLALHERKGMIALVQEAIKIHLENKEAYLLSVTKIERQ
jgi:hypothetical protein